jgi:hypothetical protein
MTHKYGYGEATYNQLKVIDRLVYTRQLSQLDFDRMDRWVSGANGFTVEFILQWLRKKPHREDLPSGVVYP